VVSLVEAEEYLGIVRILFLIAVNTGKQGEETVDHFLIIVGWNRCF
jgi:hypothetical protein